MGIVYTDEYETKKAYVEMNLSDGKYIVEYIITSPIDEKPDNVNAYISRYNENQEAQRVGYASYDNKTTSVRFDATYYIASVDSQKAISDRFYSDLVSFLE